MPHAIPQTMLGLVLVTGAFSALPLARVGSADSIGFPLGGLPSPLEATQAAELGGKAYLLGGWSQGGTDRVIIYDGSAEGGAYAAARLPSARWWNAVASDGRHVFSFGGGVPSAQIGRAHV